jgi:hypothetical protein
MTAKNGLSTIAADTATLFLPFQLPLFMSLFKRDQKKGVRGVEREREYKEKG